MTPLCTERVSTPSEVANAAEQPRIEIQAIERDRGRVERRDGS